MPRYWYDAHAVHMDASENNKSDEERDLNLRILADKKPYFMRYIYPALMKQYNEYTRNTNTKCLRNFRVPISALLEKAEAELTEEEAMFLSYYKKRMPVGINDCVMNKICRRFEAEFDGYLSKHKDDSPFDYSFLKFGHEYTTSMYYAISALYEQYDRRLKDYAASNQRGRTDGNELFGWFRDSARQYFSEECLKICSSGERLCDIVLDMCYSKAGTKRFAWDVCGDEIIASLLRQNGNILHFPVRDDEGDFEYGGMRFRMAEKEVV